MEAMFENSGFGGGIYGISYNSGSGYGNGFFGGYGFDCISNGNGGGKK